MTDEEAIPSQDFVSPDYDELASKPPTTLLLIYSTPRSGSTLVCDYVRRAGLCVPHEYFHKWVYRPILESRWQISKGDDEAFVKKLVENRTSQCGWLGINLHANYLSEWQKAIQFLPKSIERTVEIRVKRRDSYAQAVSYFWERETGAWSSAYREARRPSYDIARLAQGFGRLREMEQQLDSFL